MGVAKCDLARLAVASVSPPLNEFAFLVVDTPACESVPWAPAPPYMWRAANSQIQIFLTISLSLARMFS